MLQRNLNTTVMSQDKIARANATFMSRVYFWMMLGLMISGCVAYFVASQTTLMATLLENRFNLIILFVLQLGAVFYLSARITSMSPVTAMSVYIAYTALTGLTFSTIFLAYTAQTITSAFFVCATAFVGLSLFGYVTKRDLGPLGSFCMTGLFGLIGLTLMMLIFPSTASYPLAMTVNACGVIIFAGLTAYDTQRIKSFNTIGASSELTQKMAIHGALTLYLDFINLFLQLLSLFGRRN